MLQKIVYSPRSFGSGWEIPPNTQSMMKHTVKIEDGTWGSTTIYAHDIEQAEERARRWVLEGHWGKFEREEFVAFTIEDENGVSWYYDQAVGGFSEPECVNGKPHDWKSPYSLVGGSPSCPGCFPHGEFQWRFEEVCRHCGRYRTSISAGGPCLESKTTYRMPDKKSSRWKDRIARSAAKSRTKTKS